MTRRTRPSRPLFLSVLLVVLAALGPAPLSAAPGDEPPQPVSARGLENLQAFTRLLGLVRFFHPTDAVASMTADDWESFAIAGVQRVEGAADRQELQAELEDLFAPLAPQALLFPSEAEPSVPEGGYPGPVAESGQHHVAWMHHGVQMRPGPLFRSQRIEVGRIPASSDFRASQTFLDLVPLAGQDFELSASVRFSGTGSARVEALIYTFSGTQLTSAPVASSTWAPVSLTGTLPADAFLLDIRMVIDGAGSLDFDDLRLLADGVDRTARTIWNPDFEERAQDGVWPLGWEPASGTFGAYYEIESVHGDAASGDWFGRATGPRAWPIPTPHRAFLGGGLSVMMPLALRQESDGSVPPGRGALPLPAPDKPAGFEPSAFDRASRLAGVALAWPIVDHFYPYFEQSPGGDADWDAALTAALAGAATDADEESYRTTLRMLQADLGDGHARLDHPRVVPTARFAFTWDWVEDSLRVTSVEDGATHGMAPGDRIVAIDGEPAADALARTEGLISAATPGWRRAVALHEMASGFPGGTAELRVEPVSGAPAFDVEVTYDAPYGGIAGGPGSPEEPRPEKIEEIRPGIWYVDLTRITPPDYFGALGDLAAADGVIFDLRGYPFRNAPFDVVFHIADRPLPTARHEVAFSMRPEGTDRRWWSYGFVLPANDPVITGKMAWIIDGRAISLSELWLAPVEEFGLAELVGAGTAGTNGNVNPFPIPGDFTFRWTNLRVRRHDGSPHHGVGIQPTIPVTRTLAGVAAGRDELLEAAIEAVTSP